MKRNRKFLILVIILIGLAFAFVTSTLGLEFDGVFGKDTWKVYFDNVVIDSGSEFSIVDPVTVGTNTTELNYSVNLPKVGDTYIFYVDIVNAGTVNAMINLVNKSELPEYIDFDVSYVNGRILSKNDLLSANSSIKLKVVTSYSYDVNENDYERDKDSVDISILLEYTTATKDVKDGICPPNSTFQTDDWETIILNLQNNTGCYKVGDEKVDKVNSGKLLNIIQYPISDTYRITYRIVNLDNDNECDGIEYETACGNIIEITTLLPVYIGISYNWSSNIYNVKPSLLSTASKMDNFYGNLDNFISSLTYDSYFKFMPKDLYDSILLTNVHTLDFEDITKTSNKFYLASSDEYYGNSIIDILCDEGDDDCINLANKYKANSKQLDYYKNHDVSIYGNNGYLLKKRIGYDQNYESDETDATMSAPYYYYLRDNYYINQDGSFSIYPIGNPLFVSFLFRL